MFVDLTRTEKKQKEMITQEEKKDALLRKVIDSKFLNIHMSRELQYHTNPSGIEGVLDDDQMRIFNEVYKKYKTEFDDTFIDSDVPELHRELNYYNPYRDFVLHADSDMIDKLYACMNKKIDGSVWNSEKFEYLLNLRTLRYLREEAPKIGRFGVNTLKCLFFTDYYSLEAYKVIKEPKDYPVFYNQFFYCYTKRRDYALANSYYDMFNDFKNKKLYGLT